MDNRKRGHVEREIGFEDTRETVQISMRDREAGTSGSIGLLRWPRSYGLSRAEMELLEGALHARPSTA